MRAAQNATKRTVTNLPGTSVWLQLWGPRPLLAQRLMVLQAAQIVPRHQGCHWRRVRCQRPRLEAPFPGASTPWWLLHPLLPLAKRSCTVRCTNARSCRGTTTLAGRKSLELLRMGPNAEACAQTGPIGHQSERTQPLLCLTGCQQACLGLAWAHLQGCMQGSGRVPDSIFPTFVSLLWLLKRSHYLHSPSTDTRQPTRRPTPV